MEFDISPQKQASLLHFLRRQFFFIPSHVSDSEVTLSGKTAVVTGSNGGIGLQCCHQLRDLGLSKLILAVRDESKGHAAAAILSKSQTSMVIEVWELDMASYNSIASFVERSKGLERLDILILNAGITKLFFELHPSTGHETNVQINYLSTIYLVIKILPVLKSKASLQQRASRLVIVTTDAAPWTPFPEQDSDPLLPAFDQPGKVDMVNRYYTSRLLTHFFLLEISKRVPCSTAVIVATTPGLVHGTAALRDLNGTLNGRIADFGKRIIGYSSEIGARQLTDAAVRHGSEIHGHFLCSQKPVPSVEHSSAYNRLVFDSPII